MEASIESTAANLAQPARTARPAERAGLARRTVAAYASGAIGSGMFYAFSNAVLPLLIPSNNTLLVNLLSNTRSIEGTVIQPVVGSFSDRIWTRWGRRRPFLMTALPLSALIMALTPLAHQLWLIVACIFAFSLLFNVAIDPYNALMADITTPDERPRVNAVATVVQFVGQVGLTLIIVVAPFFKTAPQLAYPLLAALILASFAPTILGVRERPSAVDALGAAARRQRHSASATLAAVRALPMARRYLLALFAYNVGVQVIMVNLTRFAVKILHTSETQAVFLFMILVLTTGLGAIPAGLLARRFGPKAVVMAGMVLIAIGAAAALVVSSVAAVIPALIVAGLGNSCLTLTWPLLTLLIPADYTGLFAGLKTAAESISAFGSGVVAAVMVGIWDFRSIFVVLIFAVIASLLILMRVTVPQTASTDLDPAPEPCSAIQ
jgi:Na+/melibiose symporter-like transporter